MAYVSDLVDSADGMLDAVAESTFMAIAGAGGDLLAAMATLSVVMLGVNIIVQYRPIGAGQALTLAIKLILIGIIARNWSNFQAITGAVETAMNTIAGAILTDFRGGGGGGNVSASLAQAIDEFIADFAARANTALEPLGWMAGAMMSLLVTFLLSVIGAVAGLALIFAKVMITVYLGIAPIFIALWIFESTTDYFHRWLQSAVSYMIYPVVVATVLGAIVRLTSGYIASMSGSVGATIAEFIPFIIALMVMIVVIMFIPFIVNSLSGSFAAPGPGMAARGAGNAGGAVANNRATRWMRGAAVAGVAATGRGIEGLASRMAARSSRF